MQMMETKDPWVQWYGSYILPHGRPINLGESKFQCWRGGDWDILDLQVSGLVQEQTIGNFSYHGILRRDPKRKKEINDGEIGQRSKSLFG